MSKTIRSELSKAEASFIDELLRARGSRLTTMDEAPTLENVNKIRDELTSELARSGFDPDDAPTERGLYIEKMIDRLFRLVFP